MASEWIEHVKKVAAQKKITYKEAMSVAKASYKPKGKKAPAKATTKSAPQKKVGKGKGGKESAEMEVMSK